jgi:hypothetical protein
MAKQPTHVGEYVAVRTGIEPTAGRKLGPAIVATNRKEAAAKLIMSYGMPLRVMSLTWPEENRKERTRVLKARRDEAQARAARRASKSSARMKQKKGKKATAKIDTAAAPAAAK